MKHARSDYQDRIIDTAGLIPENEPVLLLRGQDVNAPATLRFWADRAAENGSDPEIVDLVLNHAQEMERWQDEHTAKVPDLPQHPMKAGITEHGLDNLHKPHPIHDAIETEGEGEK